MAGRSVYVTEKEAESMHAAIDFIGQNADGAEDREPYDKIIVNLASILEKYYRAIGRRMR